MDNRILVIGCRECGKSTLINALLGWDYLPQGDWTTDFPTVDFPEVPWQSGLILVDSPGYDPFTGFFDPRLPEQIRQADVVVVVTCLGTRQDMAAERKLLKQLLQNVPRESRFYGIPYDSGDWPKGHPPILRTKLRAAFHYQIPAGRIYLVDSMKALVASIEDDQKIQDRSGITALRRAIMRKD